MRFSRLPVLFAALLSVSCSGGSGNSIPRVAADSGQVLGAHSPDTVRLEHLPDSTFLRWTTSRGGRRIVRWESRNLYFGIPEAQLVDVNGDSAPDLFWSLAYEETVGGMLLLATDTMAQEAFRSSPSACRPPEIKKATDEGAWAILEYEASLLSGDDCRGNAPTEACHAALPTDWVVLYVLRGDRYVVDSSVGKHFYSSLAKDYATAARSLREKPAKVLCPLGSASKLEEMAARARRIAGD